MDNKFNTFVKQTKDEMVALINNKLQMGLPISVMDLIINDVSLQVKNKMNEVIEQENKNDEVSDIPIENDENKVED